MKTYKNIYSQIYHKRNLIHAWRKARKGKTKKHYVIEFEKHFRENILKLHNELKNEIYFPKPLKSFVLRDPKTRKISKSVFRDRIVHHAIVRIIEPIFEKTFIYDSCANRIGKGNLFAIKRFDKFKRKVSFNGTKKIYCLKADIKHYFQEVNHKILLEIIKRKINDEKLLNLIRKILINGQSRNGAGMPLGNLTSQFFANIYLNELDYFAKHNLKSKYYIRYVDDFISLHSSKKRLEFWNKEISRFLNKELKLELHPDKSKIIPLSKGIDFVGFRNFYYFKLLRRRSINKMRNKLYSFKLGLFTNEKIRESFQGWQAYAKWANTYELRKCMLNELSSLCLAQNSV